MTKDKIYKLHLKLAAADLTPEIREEIKARQGNLCFYCNQPIHKYVLDHLIPRHAGGGHDKYNRVAACSPCDGQKGGRLPTERELAKFQRQLGEQQ
jgi:5-methylcytosine-specific restriction endonuclease McrA